MVFARVAVDDGARRISPCTVGAQPLPLEAIFQVDELFLVEMYIGHDNNVFGINKLVLFFYFRNEKSKIIKTIWHAGFLN
jgi:hypothetical protein